MLQLELHPLCPVASMHSCRDPLLVQRAQSLVLDVEATNISCDPAPPANGLSREASLAPDGGHAALRGSGNDGVAAPNMSGFGPRPAAVATAAAALVKDDGYDDLAWDDDTPTFLDTCRLAGSGAGYAATATVWTHTAAALA
jgi:hypothetical protein